MSRRSGAASADSSHSRCARPRHIGRSYFCRSGRASGETQMWRQRRPRSGRSEGFKHFDYVNPTSRRAAPVLERSRHVRDFNTVVSGVKGNTAIGTELYTETLTTPSSLDQASTETPCCAKQISYPADYSGSHLSPARKARWHDGKPITFDDVLFLFDVLKNRGPSICAYYRHVVKVETGGAGGHLHFRRLGDLAIAVSSASCRYCRSIGGRAPTSPGASAMSRRPRLKPPLVGPTGSRICAGPHIGLRKGRRRLAGFQCYYICLNFQTIRYDLLGLHGCA